MLEDGSVFVCAGVLKKGGRVVKSILQSRDPENELIMNVSEWLWLINWHNTYCLTERWQKINSKWKQILAPTQEDLELFLRKPCWSIELQRFAEIKFEKK